MRYVAKIHVLDVMDQLIVSGYVRDCEVLDLPEREPLEFTQQYRGRGESDPGLWLAQPLHGLWRSLVDGALTSEAPPRLRGGRNTIPGVDDTAQDAMGWTAVGGPGRARGSAPRRGSGGIRG